MRSLSAHLFSYVFSQHFQDNDRIEEHIQFLLDKIEKEFPCSLTIDDITLVNCVLFQNGLCKQVDPENITLKKEHIYTLKSIALTIITFAFTVITFAVCCIYAFEKPVTIITTFLTIVSSAISIISFIIKE